MRKHFSVGYEWIDRLMPEGFLIPSSILISGPGGSGKPLIGLAVVASWLRQGGKVIFAPLQFPNPSFIEADLATLYDVRLSDYPDSTFFLKFDLDLDAAGAEIRQAAPNILSANLVNPDAWERALEVADRSLGASEPGTLLFSSALNLLLFSPTYGERTLAWLQAQLREPRDRTCLFTVSSSALGEQIAMLEEAARNLLFAEMREPDKVLRFWVARLQEVPYSTEVVTVPLDRHTLKQMKQRADAARVTKIQTIRQI